MQLCNMIRLIRNSLLIRYFWSFMSFYLLNCYVEFPDAQTNFFTENITFNDPESIIEIVVEKVLGYENTIAEYDDNDTNQNFFGKSTFSLNFFCFSNYCPSNKPKKSIQKKTTFSGAKSNTFDLLF